MSIARCGGRSAVPRRKLERPFFIKFLNAGRKAVPQVGVYGLTKNKGKLFLISGKEGNERK